MSIATFNVMFIEDDLRRRGFRHRPMGPEAPGTKIWSHSEFHSVIIVRGIEVPPGSVAPADIDEYFRRLQNRIKNMKKTTSDLVFQGGGSVKVPDWFHDWCKSRKPPIAVHIVDSQNANEVLAAIGRRPTRSQECVRVTNL